MISSLRTYSLNKSEVETKLLEGDLFSNVSMTTNPLNNDLEYTIKADENGISISIDRYRCYVIGSLKFIYNSISKIKLDSRKNLKLSHIKTAINAIDNLNIDFNKNKVSGLNLSFIIPTDILAKDLIKTNILMHNFKYYNRDVINNKSIDMKEFVYHNFTIGFYSEKKVVSQFFLKVSLNINKSVEFKNINTPNDLLSKNSLDYLFNLFMLRFNETIIVDNYSEVQGKDGKLLHQFLNYRYWENLAKTKSRQTLSRHKKKFKSLIIKHNLNTQKLKLEKELFKAFNESIKY